MNGNWFGLAAFGGVFAMLYTKLKAVGSRIVGLLLVRETFLGEAIPRDLALYLYKTMWRSSLMPHVYDEATLFEQTRKGFICVPALRTTSTVLWLGWRPIWLSTSGGEATLTYLRGAFDIDTLYRDCERFWRERIARKTSESSRYAVYRTFGRRIETGSGGRSAGGRQNESSGEPTAQARAIDSSPAAHVLRTRTGVTELLGHTWDEFQPAVVAGVRQMDRLAVASDALSLCRVAVQWLESCDWYIERNIPWRLGMLLHGAPGNGKTSFVRSLAQDLKIPVFVFDLSTMDNEDLNTAWRSAVKDAPCVILLEDIDGVFNGRKLQRGEGGRREALTFDALLNTIDGVESSGGVLLVVTTNDLSAVDPALGVPLESDPTRTTRAGRLDYAAEFGPPSAAGRELIARRIMAGFEGEVPGLVRAGAGESGAQFQERCRRRALELYWAREHPAGGDKADHVGPERLELGYAGNGAVR
jgi:AAA+ superfamily predicted ATPase